MICSNCHFENPDGIKFCGNCGTSQQLSCSSCGFENPPGFKYCGNCGLPLGKQAAGLSQPARVHQRREKIEAERRHLTVLFCDLVGSTALSDELDPEDLRVLITEYQKVCEKVVARYEGHVAQYLGDGILVYFGYPTAHENDAHRAVSSGLGILEAVQKFNKHLKESNHSGISVRIGIHTGHVVVGDMGGTGQAQQLALGATPNIAARLEGLAAPDTVIISADTYKLIQRYFSCDNKGAQAVKGISYPIEIYQVMGENTARSRFEANQAQMDQTPIVGREKEINRLLEFWEAAGHGSSRTIMLSGEAGIGKSRVLQQVIVHVASDSNTWLMNHQCSPYHKRTPYYAFVQAIKEVALQFEGNEPANEQIKRLEGFLLQQGLSLEGMVPLFAQIMGISLEGSNYQPTPFGIDQQKEKLTKAFLKMFLGRAVKQNLLVIFEDLHWADPYTLEVIEHLINRPPVYNILTILSFRPEFDPPWPIQPHIIPLPLTNLPGSAVEEIISNVAGGKLLPQDLRDQIIQKTDGVPLFTEELTKMVLGSEMVKEHEDHYELTGPLSSLQIPSSLHDSLIARLDRMSDTKEVAQIGAVIGREFSYELINIASRMEANALQACLSQLVESEILLELGIRPHTTFRFRHALIRDAAYESLLKSQRKNYHLRIANDLTNNFPDTAENKPEMLAYQFEKAGSPEEASAHWIKAGERAKQLLAYDEAHNFLERGLSLIYQMATGDARSKLELKALSVQVPLLMITKGWVSIPAFKASCRMKELAEAQEDATSLFEALRGVITYQLFTGNPDKALQHATEALEIAEKLQIHDLIIEGHRLIGQSSIYAGSYQQSLESFEKAIVLSGSNGNSSRNYFTGADPGVFSLIQSSHVIFCLGYPDQARERAKMALLKANKMKQPYGQVLCNFLSSNVACLVGDFEKGAVYGEKCKTLCDEYGITMFANESKNFLGYVLVQMDDVEKGLQAMHESLKWRVEHNIMAGIHLHMHNIISGFLYIGNFDRGVQAISQAEDFIKKSGDRYFLSEIYRLKGEFLLARHGEERTKEIEKYYKKSIQIAKKQHAKSLELRAATSMARLWSTQGKNSEALKLVSDVYNWFTEGFTTQDLTEARQLIEAMSAKTTLSGN